MSDVDFLIGKKFNDPKFLLGLNSDEIFSNVSIGFLTKVSKFLLNLSNIRNYPDVATFAFFCRSGNLNALKTCYLEDSIRLGKGVIFHVAPGNVPVNFAYSLMVGILSGNINIVRLPSKNFEQVTIIVNAINNVLNSKEYSKIFQNRIFLVKYPRDSDATKYFSEFCDVRVIWGGDHTVNRIREYPTPAKSLDVTFSNRYSAAIIDAEAYLNIEDKSKIATAFYNDTFLFDQNACTSPHTVYWLGSELAIEEAKSVFWTFLDNKLNEIDYDISQISSVNKLTTFYTQTVLPGVVSKTISNSNLIWRVNNMELSKDIINYKCDSGYFNEFSLGNLNELDDQITRSHQTLGYLGVEKSVLEAWIKNCKPLGVDRIVPVGRTMDFSLFWDGIDLIRVLSRRIEVL